MVAKSPVLLVFVVVVRYLVCFVFLFAKPFDVRDRRKLGGEN